MRRSIPNISNRAFSNSEDLDLLDRINNKEETSTFFIIESQVDIRVCDDTVRKEGNYTLQGDINALILGLKKEQRRNITKFKEGVKSDTIKQTCDKPINSNIIYTSEVCHSLYAYFDKKDLWDATMKYRFIQKL